jgi:hypothetical protein
MALRSIEAEGSYLDPGFIANLMIQGKTDGMLTHLEGIPEVEKLRVLQESFEICVVRFEREGLTGPEILTKESNPLEPQTSQGAQQRAAECLRRIDEIQVPRQI